MELRSIEYFVQVADEGHPVAPVRPGGGAVRPGGLGQPAQAPMGGHPHRAGFEPDGMADHKSRGFGFRFARFFTLGLLAIARDLGSAAA